MRMASRTVEIAFRGNFSLATGEGYGPRGRPPGDRCPTWGGKTWLRPTFGASAQEVSWSGSVRTWQNCQQGRVFANAVPNRVVEVTHTSTNTFVRARVWQRHNELLGAAVMEKASLLRHHNLLRARIRHVVHDKRRGGPLRKQDGSCQNSTTCSIEYSSLGSKTDGAEPSVSIWGAGSVLLRDCWAPGARDESGSTGPGLVAPSLIGEKGQTVLVLPPMVSAVDLGGHGALNPFFLTRAVDLPILAGLYTD